MNSQTTPIAVSINAVSMEHFRHLKTNLKTNPENVERKKIHREKIRIYLLNRLEEFSDGGQVRGNH